MCKKECEEVLRTHIGTIVPVFKNNLKQEVEKILSCVYECLRPKFIRQSVISYKNYTQDTVEFISNTSFTEGVLKFVEKATEGNIYEGNASLKTLVLAFCKIKFLEHLQKEDRLSIKNKKFAFDNRENSILTEEESDKTLEIQFAMIEQALTIMEPEDRQIIVWRHLEEKSNDEIAGLLGINVTSATNRIYRCMQRLKRKIQDNQ